MMRLKMERSGVRMELAAIAVEQQKVTDVLEDGGLRKTFWMVSGSVVR
jgi:hypothetical protein